MRYVTAIRTASIAASKQCDGVMAATMGNGRLAVAAVHGVEEVGLLGLRGQAGRRAAPLDVDDEEGELEADGQADRLRLQVEPRARRGGDAERAAEGRADGGADAGDLVLGLEGAHAEVLVLGQLVEDVGGRGDRVRPEEQGQVRLDGRRRSAPRPGRCCR